MSMATTVASRIAAAPAALLGFLALLATVVAADLGGSPVAYAAAAGALASALLLGARGWCAKRSGRIALLLAAVSLAAVLLGAADPLRVIASAARFADALTLLICVGLMRPGLAALQLDRAIAQQIGRVPLPLRPAALVVGSACGALGGSFGAIATVGAALGQRVTRPALAARASMRGLVLSMLLGPSVASVAAVIAVFPDVSWGGSLALGAPLALAGAAMACLGRERLEIAPGVRAGGDGLRALGAIIAVPVFAALLRQATGLSPTVAISLACAIVALCLLSLAHPGEPASAV